MLQPRYEVLFICTGNSARSIFAESILRTEAGDRFSVHSAGTKPNSELNPFAVEILEQKGARCLAPALEDRGGIPRGPRRRSSISCSRSATGRRTRNAPPGPVSPSAPIGACRTR